MWNFKKDIEAHVRKLDRYVNILFVAEMHAAGFEKRGRTWKQCSDFKPALAITTATIADAQADPVSVQAALAEVATVQESIMKCLHRVTSTRAALEAHPEYWPETMEYAQAVQSDLIGYLGRCFRHNDLEDMHLENARCMRQDLGAVTRLEKLLVEFMIVARLYGENSTDVNPKDAQRRIKQAAEMLDTARRLLGSQSDGTMVTHAPKIPEATDNVTNANAAEHGGREADPPAANRGEPATRVPAVGESTPANIGAGVPCHVKEAA